MASVNIHCPRCQSAQEYRHGQNPKGRDRFRCRDCHRVFQLTYTYQARKPGMKEMITEMAFNGAGVRDTARTLKIGINTIIRTLKNSHQRILLLRLLHMLMWRLSASLMSNGATLAVKPGTRTTPQQAVYWPTLLVPEPIKRAGSYWHCLHPSTSACSPAMTGTAMAGWCRRISI